ncbi:MULTISPECIES: hypothetical protein [unclassified Nostoc]|uniref:hypothetical protein n=1 Tax=unclassified Nostoc TaxID=2593658 RepID=UPI001E33E24D|nr:MULTISPECIES: hypothetical protein [unclassified Nostoc]MCC5662237.1 hypothetical protein [Nostoc sp. XA010]MDZ7950545.1 hypothetical protein [Nostoc sp. DedQUE09]
MTTTKIHSVVCIHSRVLVVFYTPCKCWQFRIVSPGGTVLGDYPIYYSAEAAAKAGREWIYQKR